MQKAQKGEAELEVARQAWRLHLNVRSKRIFLLKIRCNDVSNLYSIFAINIDITDIQQHLHTKHQIICHIIIFSRRQNIYIVTSNRISWHQIICNLIVPSLHVVILITTISTSMPLSTSVRAILDWPCVSTLPGFTQTDCVHSWSPSCSILDGIDAHMILPGHSTLKRSACPGWPGMRKIIADLVTDRQHNKQCSTKPKAMLDHYVQPQKLL